MEVKKYNPSVVKPRTKTKPMPLPKAKTKLNHKTKLEDRDWRTEGKAPLSLENKNKLDILSAKGFVKTIRK